jgi:hypothetical protein
LTLASAVSSQAALYNVDWKKSGDGTPVFTGAAAVGSTGDVWNTTDPESNILADLASIADSSGTVSTVSVVWSDELQSSINSGAIDFSTSGPGGTNLDPLMEDYGFTAPGNTATVTISGLALNSSYTIYLFGHPDGFSQDVTFAVTDAAESAQTLAASKNDNNGFVAGTDFAIFTGNTGGTGTVVYTQTSFTGFSGSAGFQLDVVPEPSVALLGGLGLLGLLRRRR